MRIGWLLLRGRLDKAMKAFSGKQKSSQQEEFLAAHAEVLALEREVASAKAEEYAVRLDFPVKWDAGAPLPYLLMNDYKVFLTFYVYQPDPNWDGTYVTVKNPADGSVESLAVVEFQRCLSARMGTPNDEVFTGHPLCGKGLEGYTAQVVKNSRWLKELEAINRVHPQYDPAMWTGLTHYIFWFHDSTFECIARSFKVEQFKGSMAELLAVVSKRLVAV